MICIWDVWTRVNVLFLYMLCPIEKRIGSTRYFCFTGLVAKLLIYGQLKANEKNLP